ncbi:MAG: hypothetical protein ACK5Y8_13100, partial [Betaproteobacteria bacterium]
MTATPPPDRRLPLDPARRVLLRGGLASSLAPLFGACAATARAPVLGFASVPPSSADALVVADGYVATPFMP